ncbi:MAG TPA: lytic transglycosylase domain-containing protein [Acidobacteriaceae bacterium]
MRHTGIAASVLLLAGAAMPLRAAEHITLRNGFDLICDHREAVGDHVRLYMTATGPDFTEVSRGDIASSEFVELPEPAPPPAAAAPDVQAAIPTPAEIREMAAKAGAAHDLDVELLASVIRAESNGNVRAISRAGARGLMQLMPDTANQLGVTDSFRADQNIDGGTTYLNALLKRYHDNLALALAAYNAGPAAVDRYHGIPPYRETRLYVARIIHDFNRRKLETAHPTTLMASGASPSAGN